MWEKSIQIFTMTKYQKKFSMYLPVGNTVYRSGKNYYSEVFLEEWKYISKGRKDD